MMETGEIDMNGSTWPKTDIIIIGAGPAGIAAGIQLRRYGLDVLVLEKDSPGGLLHEANFVENYPGFPEGISGTKLVSLLIDHLDGAGVRRFTDIEITSVDYRDGSFILGTSADPRAYSSRFLVIATGTIPNPQAIPPVSDQWGRVLNGVRDLIKGGIGDCTIAIVGGGDAAFDYSLGLTRNDELRKNTIHILNRSSHVKCLPLLWDRARNNERINYHKDTSIIRMTATKETLHLLLQSPGRTWELETDYLIYAIGRRPNLDFLSNTLRERLDDLRKEGLLYLVGDVGNGIHRQAAIAVGQGIEAAMRIAEIFPEPKE
jgi:thioredoxin reductase (NADPH)